MKYKIEFISGAILFGTIGVFRRMTPFPSGILSAVRLALCIVFFLCVLLIMRRKPDMAVIKANLKYLIPSGLCIGLYLITAAESFIYTSVPKATLCFFIAPIVVVLLSPLFFDERINLRKVICLFTALIGLVLISGVVGSGALQPGEYRGIVMALLTAAMLVGVMIFNKKIQGVGGIERTMIQFMIGLVAAVPYAIIVDDPADIVFSPVGILFLLLLALVSTGLSYMLYFMGIEGMPMQAAAMLSYLEPISACVLSAIILHEYMSLMQVIGAVLLLGSAIVCQKE
ncbi:MAG: EamA family transporter [Firmicutes bacterium]|nr:EamA family transporter [Bacillota bacterium]